MIYSYHFVTRYDEVESTKYLLTLTFFVLKCCFELLQIINEIAENYKLDLEKDICSS